MKRRGSILDFTHERNRDLMRAYRDRLKQTDFIIAPDIFEAIANSPASQFWVSEERACAVITSMLAGDKDWDYYKFKSIRMRKCKREMFLEIFRRFLIDRQANPRESVFNLVANIVRQPAPKFYLTPRTVGEIIYRIKNGWYDKHRKQRNPENTHRKQPPK